MMCACARAYIYTCNRESLDISIKQKRYDTVLLKNIKRQKRDNVRPTDRAVEREEMTVSSSRAVNARSSVRYETRDRSVFTILEENFYRFLHTTNGMNYILSAKVENFLTLIFHEFEIFT